MLHETAAHEPAQYPLDHRPQRTVRPGEPGRITAQKFLEVLFDQPEQRGLPPPTRPVHPRTDLHANPPAGRRDRRESRVPGMQRGKDSATSSRRERSGCTPRGFGSQSRRSSRWPPGPASASARATISRVPWILTPHPPWRRRALMPSLVRGVLVAVSVSALACGSSASGGTSSPSSRPPPAGG